MNTIPAQAEVLSASNYQTTRFNALRHGVLSRYTVLPWEDEQEYRAVLDALVAEHAPEGPTEEHLVEELAGIIWRKRRMRMAEAALFREELRSDAASSLEPEHIAGAALLPITGMPKANADIAQAIAATPAETGRDLRGIRRDQAMSTRAFNISAGHTDAYGHALAALRDDTRSYWQECLEDQPTDGLRYEPTAEALKAWLTRHWRDLYDGPIAELEHRDVIRQQALGAAYATPRVEVITRYEVHLDRKLERTLAMLVRLRELRRAVEPV
jgi:hypothetical protein